MILFPLAALVIGFALFYISGRGFEADEAFARYTAIAVLAGLDTVLGGLRARLSDEDEFDDVIFVSGFFVNALLASTLVVLGEKLGLEAGLGQGRVSAMMLAAAVVFGARIFNNLAALRRLLIEKWRRGTERGAEPPPAQSHLTESRLTELPDAETPRAEPAAHPEEAGSGPAFGSVKAHG